MIRRLAAALSFCASAAALAAGAGAGADDQAFDVKPGLWQVTITGSASGAPSVPAEVVSRLTPEQRAQFEAALRAAMARAGQPRVVRQCITAEQLRSGPDFAGSHRAHCQQTIVARTATEIELREACTGNGSDVPPMSIAVRMTATGRETVAGAINIVRGAGDKTMALQQKLNGKWLGAECGAVKPQPAQ